MELIQGLNPVGQIITANPGKQIGKFGVPHNKIKDGNLNTHAGHEECIAQLRSAGMEIIIFEIINIDILYASLYLDNEPQVSQTTALNICVSKNLDVDYLIYDSDDFHIPFSQATITAVDNRLAAEDYKNKLNISDIAFPVLRLNLQYATERNNTGFTIARSYKGGPEIFAGKHYLNKYLPGLEMLIIEPLLYGNAKYPLTTAIPDSNEISIDTINFMEYFHGLEKSSIVADYNQTKIDITAFAEGSNYSVEKVSILDDSEFVGTGRIFISVECTDEYGVLIPAHRWL